MDVSIDLGVGVTEGTAALFNSAKNLHSDFNATVNLIYIPFKSKARMEDVTGNVVRTQRNFYYGNLLTDRTDSLLCLAVIAGAYQLKVFDEKGVPALFSIDNYINEIEKRSEVELPALTETINVIGRAKKIDLSDTTEFTPRQQQLLRDLVKKYFQASVKVNKLAAMLGSLPNLIGRSDLLVSDFIKATTKMISINDDDLNYQVSISEKLWNYKRLKWWTFSLFVKRQGFSVFDQHVIVRTDTSSTTYGMAIRKNLLYVRRNLTFYAKYGVDFYRANNIVDFSKVEYVQQDSLATNGSKKVYSESSGVTYTGAKLDHGLGLGLSVEAYVFFSRKNFVPGLFVKYDHTFSSLLEKDMAAALEAGIPFNINSPDKTKSVVSVAPYISFPNLAASKKSEDGDTTETVDKPERSDYIIGIKIGLPISLSSK